MYLSVRSLLQVLLDRIPYDVVPRKVPVHLLEQTVPGHGSRWWPQICPVILCVPSKKPDSYRDTHSCTRLVEDQVSVFVDNQAGVKGLNVLRLPLMPRGV